MPRIVVVGAGMVGQRCVEELLDRDQRGHWDITLLGAEEYEPYNRVLLSDLVAGKVAAAALALPTVVDRRTTGTLEFVRGVQIQAIDRASRRVVAADGRTFAFDVLVLATGASARIPAGMATPLPRGVHALRSLDDARAIVAATLNSTRAVVIGGGVLGLEAVTGLAKRGISATVLHPGPTLMERQLSPAAAEVLRDSMHRAGIGVATSSEAVGLETVDGRVSAVVTPQGIVPADLVILACGTIPETALARGAGLAVDRGIVVGPDLATTEDDAIFAIGDCAQPPEGGSGLIAQGWDQARQLARRLTGGAPGAGSTSGERVLTARTDVVRVKGVGLEVVVLGPPVNASACGELRHIALSDPRAGRFIEIVVGEDRLVSATCIGSGQVAADLTAAYTRGTPLPADPAQLLIRGMSGAPEPATTPTNMPGRMTVCRCNGVTKSEIVACWSKGATSVADIAAGTRATTGCGGCVDVVSGLVDWLRSSDPDSRTALPSEGPRAEKGDESDSSQSVRNIVEINVPEPKHFRPVVETRVP